MGWTRRTRAFWESRHQPGTPANSASSGAQRKWGAWWAISCSPHDFDPGRFLPERGQQPAWLPFGFGPRVCIAAQFALAEMAVVIARLLTDLELEPVGPEPEISLQVTTRSVTGLNVSARRRAQG